MHFVHIVRWTKRPPSRIRTRCRLGWNLRLLALIEKLRLCPKVVVLPQFAHLAIVACTSLSGSVGPCRQAVYYHIRQQASIWPPTNPACLRMTNRSHDDR